MRTRWSGLPFREFYNPHGNLVGAVLFEQSPLRQEDAVSGGRTVLVTLDRHSHIAWRFYDSSTKPFLDDRPYVPVDGGFISIIGPDSTEIGTVTLGRPVKRLFSVADMPLTLQDAAGKAIGAVERTRSRSGVRAHIQRAILDANGVEVGQVRTGSGRWSVIEIDPAMPDVLRRFIFPLDDLFREWERPKGG
jgi:hypothetical protein